MNVQIYTRNKTDKGWRYQRVNTGPGSGNYKRRGIVPVGPFYLRFSIAGKQSFQPAGNTLQEALTEAAKCQPEVDAKREELTANGQMNLEKKTEAFLLETQANKARKTWQAYGNSINYFLQSCEKRFVENVGRDDMLQFKTHLRSEKLSDRSVYNNFLNVMVFFKWCGHKTEVKGNDWPAKPEREPEEYSEEEITALLEAAKKEERLVLRCFLYTGVRSSELAHLTYGDIDYKHSVWTIRPKDGWQTKTEASQRRIPVDPDLTRKIAKRKEELEAKNSDLIFPNTEGTPNHHLVRIVKRVAKRAELTGRVDDHKFRSTAITRWLRQGISPQDVMRWVGHQDLKTILRYAANINVQKAASLSGEAFREFAAVGGD